MPEYWQDFLAHCRSVRCSSEELDLSCLTDAELGGESNSEVTPEVLAQTLTRLSIPLQQGIERTFFFWWALPRERWLEVYEESQLYSYNESQDWRELLCHSE